MLNDYKIKCIKEQFNKLEKKRCEIKQTINDFLKWLFEYRKDTIIYPFGFNVNGFNCSEIKLFNDEIEFTINGKFYKINDMEYRDLKEVYRYIFGKSEYKKLFENNFSN